jgi:hypothetical protein
MREDGFSIAGYRLGAYLDELNRLVTTGNARPSAALGA